MGVLAFTRVVFFFPHVLKSRPLSAANIEDFLAAIGNVALDTFDHPEQQVMYFELLQCSVAAQESFQVFSSL